MNTLNTSAPWVPYKIPACPEPEDKIYALSIKDGATPDKNPSQFLEWKEILPTGEDNDILKWSGDKWVVSSPSGSESEPHYLNYNGNDLSWSPVLPKGSTKGDLLYWDPAAGEGGDWVVLSAPSNEGSILYWNGEGWNFLSPPSGSGLKVLTANEGTLAWASTQDC